MSYYINQMNCSVAEVARLEFNELKSVDGPCLFSITVAMDFELLKDVYATIGKTISEHEANIKKMAENNKKKN